MVQQHSQSPWRPFVESDCAHIHKIPKGGPFAGRIPEDAGRSKIQCDDINSGVRESVSSRTHERRATTRSPLARDSREKTARMENPGQLPPDGEDGEDRASRHNRAQSRHQSSPKLGYFRGERSNIRAKPRGVMGRASLTSRGGAPQEGDRCPLVAFSLFVRGGATARQRGRRFALMTPAAEKDPRGFCLARISPSECESNAPARLYDEASLPETRFRLGLFAGESSEIPISTEKSLTALLCDADDSFITIRIADADV